MTYLKLLCLSRIISLELILELKWFIKNTQSFKVLLLITELPCGKIVICCLTTRSIFIECELLKHLKSSHLVKHHHFEIILEGKLNRVKWSQIIKMALQKSEFLEVKKNVWQRLIYTMPILKMVFLIL